MEADSTKTVAEHQAGIAKARRLRAAMLVLSTLFFLAIALAFGKGCEFWGNC